MWDRVARDERVDRVAADAKQCGNLRHIEDIGVLDGRQLRKRRLHDWPIVIGGGHDYVASVLAAGGAGVNAL